jgi:hypothetical protein
MLLLLREWPDERRLIAAAGSAASLSGGAADDVVREWLGDTLLLGVEWMLFIENPRNWSVTGVVSKSHTDAVKALLVESALRECLDPVRSRIQ